MSFAIFIGTYIPLTYSGKEWAEGFAGGYWVFIFPLMIFLCFFVWENFDYYWKKDKTIIEYFVEINKYIKKIENKIDDWIDA